MKPVVLITRPIDGSLRFTAALRVACGADAEVVISPLLEVRLLTPEVHIPPRASLVFTSDAGVAAARGVISSPAGVHAFCVGDRTAEAASQAGFEAVSAGGDLNALVEVVARESAGPLVYLRGRHVSGDLVGAMARHGIECTEYIVYEQRSKPLSSSARAALIGGAPCLVPVFSARSADRFLDECPSEATPRIVAMSSAVAAVFAGTRFSVEIAAAPSLSAMVATTCRSMREMPRTNPA